MLTENNWNQMWGKSLVYFLVTYEFPFLLECCLVFWNTTYTSFHFKSLLFSFQHLVVQTVSRWARWPRPWLTWPGRQLTAPRRTSLLCLPHAAMRSVTLWKQNAWWGASPAALTTRSRWRPSVAPGTRRSAPTTDSLPVRPQNWPRCH